MLSLMWFLVMVVQAHRAGHWRLRIYPFAFQRVIRLNLRYHVSKRRIRRLMFRVECRRVFRRQVLFEYYKHLSRIARIIFKRAYSTV